LTLAEDNSPRKIGLPPPTVSMTGMCVRRVSSNKRLREPTVVFRSSSTVTMRQSEIFCMMSRTSTSRRGVCSDCIGFSLWMS